MKYIKFLPMSMSFVLAFAMSGCGGNGSSSSDSITISGKAIDPYLSGSKVFLDLNENKKLDSNEPSTITDKNGDYTLNIPKEYHGSYHTLVVSDGVDTGTNKPFHGTLTAVKGVNKTTQNITPLTSVVEARYHYCRTHQDKSCHDRLDEIKRDVAPYLGLREDEIDADIVVLSDRGDHQALKTALALQRGAEHHDSEHPYRFYENMTKEHFSDGYGWRDNLKTSDPESYKTVNKIMESDIGDRQANDFAKYIDKIIDKDTDISDIFHL